MTPDHPGAQEIADFLRQNPDFLNEHADVFATIEVPHPYKEGVISLAERQILTLRARLEAREAHLHQLLHHADGNQRIHQGVMAWCAHMLAEPEPRRIPDLIVTSLSRQFELDSIALRLWDLAGLPDGAYAQDVAQETRRYAASLNKPYCGPVQAQDAAAWLENAPASLALLPLRTLQAQQPIGLLVLGSSDEQRFTTDMGTEFLEQIALLAGAALSRLAHDEPDAIA
ncbi:DUF484 family protein [Castellaniella sp.]|uniref:DUF484 family protein n=1 Tax=Castellaniella sp. TaxID=1955812 RepID=UPI00356976B3